MYSLLKVLISLRIPRTQCLNYPPHIPCTQCFQYPPPMTSYSMYSVLQIPTSYDAVYKDEHSNAVAPGADNERNTSYDGADDDDLPAAESVGHRTVDWTCTRDM